MPEQDSLRPVERRMLRLAESGMSEVEIAWRFRRSPRFVRQVLELSRQPGRRAAEHRDDGGRSASGRQGLRPLERRVLQLRDEGAALGDLAPRFRRTPRFLEQVEGLARYKLANG